MPKVVDKENKKGVKWSLLLWLGPWSWPVETPSPQNWIGRQPAYGPLEKIQRVQEQTKGNWLKLILGLEITRRAD